MSKAGFATVDISPRVFPVRTYWGTVDEQIDPIYARAVVFGDGDERVAILSLDVVIVERVDVLRIREQVEKGCGIAGSRVMVCATHNHACPAVIERPWSAKDPAYVDLLVEEGARAVVEADRARCEVEVGSGSGYEGRVSFNRRYIKRNGSVVSQPSPPVLEADVLYGELVIDPEIGVLSVRGADGRIIGLLVNFACHPVHLMGKLSSGFPGVLCDRLKAQYGEDVVCIFLNGPCGNIIHRNYEDPEQADTKEFIGGILAEDVQGIVAAIEYGPLDTVVADSRTVKLAYREIEGLAANLDQLERFNVFASLIKNGWYSWSLERLRELHAQDDGEEAELQLIRIGDVYFSAIPAEYFVQLGLRIKEESPVRNCFLVTLANGWLGYIPHRAAFDRIGGHESTWCYSSRLGPSAGDDIADAVLALVREHATV